MFSLDEDNLHSVGKEKVAPFDHKKEKKSSIFALAQKSLTQVSPDKGRLILSPLFFFFWSRIEVKVFNTVKNAWCISNATVSFDLHRLKCGTNRFNCVCRRRRKNLRCNSCWLFLSLSFSLFLSLSLLEWILKLNTRRKERLFKAWRGRFQNAFPLSLPLSFLLLCYAPGALPFIPNNRLEKKKRISLSLPWISFSGDSLK